jgi:hypothetical protein
MHAQYSSNFITGFVWRQTHRTGSVHLSFCRRLDLSLRHHLKRKTIDLFVRRTMTL